LVREALIVALVNLPTDRADQISDVPSSVLVRPTKAQVSPPPETVAF
jgi:hypothetical protein